MTRIELPVFKTFTVILVPLRLYRESLNGCEASDLKIILAAAMTLPIALS